VMIGNGGEELWCARALPGT